MGEELKWKIVDEESTSLSLISHLFLFLSYMYPVFNDTTGIYSECD